MTAARGIGSGRVDDQATVVGNGESLHTLTAADIAELVHGELVGASDVSVSAVAPIDRATPTDVSFLASAKYAALLASSSPGVLLVTPELAGTAGRVAARIVVARPHEALLTLLPRLYRAPARFPGVHDTVRIGRGARIGREVCLAPYVVIGDGAVIGDGVQLDAHCVVGAAVEIGPDSHLFPNVTVYSGSSLGSRVTVHAGATIGSDGFGYAFAGGAHQKIQHVGRCRVEDDVEIGANTTIDRGSIDDTVIGAGTKIDNLVQVGHNVHVGRLCLIMAQVGIAGSARIGDGVIVAGQAGVGGHVDVGAGAKIGGQSAVMGDVPAGETWSGYPARPHRESLRATAALLKLAAMMKRLERLLADRE